MTEPTLREVFERVEEVSTQMTLVLETLNTFAAQRVEDYQRLNRHDARIEALEQRIASDPPPPIFRAPQPSLTSEERGELARTQTESMRVIARAMKAAPKLTAIAIVVGSVATGLVIGAIQSCH